MATHTFYENGFSELRISNIAPSSKQAIVQYITVVNTVAVNVFIIIEKNSFYIFIIAFLFNMILEHHFDPVLLFSNTIDFFKQKSF